MKSKLGRAIHSIWKWEAKSIRPNFVMAKLIEELRLENLLLITDLERE